MVGRFLTVDKSRCICTLLPYLSGLPWCYEAPRHEVGDVFTILFEENSLFWKEKISFPFPFPFSFSFSFSFSFFFLFSAFSSFFSFKCRESSCLLDGSVPDKKITESRKSFSSINSYFIRVIGTDSDSEFYVQIMLHGVVPVDSQVRLTRESSTRQTSTHFHPIKTNDFNTCPNHPIVPSLVLPVPGNSSENTLKGNLHQVE